MIPSSFSEEIQMAASVQKRNYSLTGPEGKRALERGITSAEWYESPIPRKRMKELMKRKNGPAVRDTMLWLVLLIGAGILAYHSWGTWWAVPAFLVYGILYCSPGDSRWHEMRTRHGI
jgi:fatty acid desaturase